MYDVAIIGLGSVGSATALYCSKLGLSVIGFEQFEFGHDLGSFAGNTRITRQAIGEHRSYSKRAIRSLELIKQNENFRGELFLQNGTAIVYKDSQIDSVFHHGNDNFLQNTLISAKTYNVEHSIYDKDNTYFPGYNVYLEPTSGTLFSQRIVRRNIELANKNGAALYFNTKGALSSNTVNGIAVKNIIVCTGAWQNIENIKVTRQVQHFYKTDKLNGPNFIWQADIGCFYGFGNIDGIVKIATET